MSTSSATGTLFQREPSALNRTFARLTARLHGYIPATVAIVLGLILTYGSDFLLGQGAVHLFFVWLMIILIGAWCGYGPGLLTVFCVTVVIPLLMKPGFTISQINLAGAGILTVVSLIVSQTARARRRAEALLSSMNQELDLRVREKTAALENANEELQHRLAELETLYAKVPVGLCFLDPELRFIRVNEELALVNAGTGPHAGQSLLQVLPQTLAAVVEPLYRRVLESGEPLIGHEVYARGPTPEAECYWWSLSCARVESEDGAVLGLQVIVQDITERKLAERALQQANEELRQANRDLEQFAYSASHDLQEPLRIVAIYSQMLLKKFGGRLGPDADKYIGYTVEGARRMESLVRDLLAFTQASSVGDAPAGIADANICLQRAFGNLQAAIAEAGAVIEAQPLPAVRMHAVHLEQLFLNLISNSIKYRGENPPRIIVDAHPRGDEWVFSVTDNGIGIPPEYREQIFGLFKRLHTSAEYSGTGIGLAICQRIVERHQGKIWVESAESGGATFLFSLPSAIVAADRASLLHAEQG